MDHTNDQSFSELVDEYQDVNPSQEELIRRLVAGGASLTVVGDDDQAIYQWRGSTVRNIITFTERYAGVQTFVLDVNRRSLPDIITTAAGFSLTISTFCMILNTRMPEITLPNMTYLVSIKLNGAAVVM
jgi:superfamily I DNA/RNA helicase